MQCMPMELDTAWWTTWRRLAFSSHLCDEEDELDHVAWGKVTSIDIAIQLVAYQARHPKGRTVYLGTTTIPTLFPKDGDGWSLSFLDVDATQQLV